MCKLILLLFICLQPILAAVEYKYREGDRLLILAPHPDDEILGTGGLIYGALEAKRSGLDIDVKVVVMTCGDGYKRALDALIYRDMLRDEDGNGVLDFVDLGYHRCGESMNAMLALGLNQNQFIHLGFPDGSLKKMANSSTSVTSYYTKKRQIPYSFAYFPGAYHSSYNLKDFVAEISSEFEPTTIFTTTPTDSHGDHSILHDLVQEHIGDSNIDHLEYLIHWEGVDYSWPYSQTDRWPYPPKHVAPDYYLDHAKIGFNWLEKKEVLQYYASQMLIDSSYLNKFAKNVEIFWKARSRKKDYLIN